MLSPSGAQRRYSFNTFMLMDGSVLKITMKIKIKVAIINYTGFLEKTIVAYVFLLSINVALISIIESINKKAVRLGINIKK